MKSLLVFTILAGAVALIHGDCRDQYNTCKASYDRGKGQVGSGSAADDLCNVGNTYIACLGHLSQLTICSSMLTTLNTDRRKTEELLNNNASGCLLCTQEVDKCKSDFIASKSQAGNDITVICKDGQTMVLCLHRVDNRKECHAEKNRIEVERRKAEEKLTNGGCDTGTTCITGVDNCNTQQQAANQAARTKAQQCTVSNAYYNCMNAQKSVCTGEYLKDVTNAMAFEKAFSQDQNCTIVLGTSGVTSQHSYSFVTSLFAPLVLAVAAVFK